MAEKYITYMGKQYDARYWRKVPCPYDIPPSDYVGDAKPDMILERIPLGEQIDTAFKPVATWLAISVVCGFLLAIGYLLHKTGG